MDGYGPSAAIAREVGRGGDHGAAVGHELSSRRRARWFVDAVGESGGDGIWGRRRCRVGDPGCEGRGRWWTGGAWSRNEVDGGDRCVGGGVDRVVVGDARLIVGVVAIF